MRHNDDFLQRTFKTGRNDTLRRILKTGMELRNHLDISDLQHSSNPFLERVSNQFKTALNNLPHETIPKNPNAQEYLTLMTSLFTWYLEKLVLNAADDLGDDVDNPNGSFTIQQQRVLTSFSQVMVATARIIQENTLTQEDKSGQEDINRDCQVTQQALQFFLTTSRSILTEAIPKDDDLKMDETTRKIVIEANQSLEFLQQQISTKERVSQLLKKFWWQNIAPVPSSTLFLSRALEDAQGYPHCYVTPQSGGYYYNSTIFHHSLIKVGDILIQEDPKSVPLLAFDIVFALLPLVITVFQIEFVEDAQLAERREKIAPAVFNYILDELCRITRETHLTQKTPLQALQIESACQLLRDPKQIEMLLSHCERILDTHFEPPPLINDPHTAAFIRNVNNATNQQEIKELLYQQRREEAAFLCNAFSKVQTELNSVTQKNVWQRST
ncbi:MAG: hypothetical protein GKR77_00875, partial [Legionellales bacterium]|nr:hypothetical protein [Legionellales bacterium]